MLSHLSIRDVVLIDALDVELDRGLTVLTGETGAGKSIVLDALGLALGGRADASMIRDKAERLSVAASFLLPADHPALRLIADQGMSGEDGAVVLRRVVGRDGRSRAFINDQPAGVALLKSVGALLVEVHGQFDTHGLLDPGTHLEVLDRFRTGGRSAADDVAVAAAYQSWRAAEADLKAFQDRLTSSIGDRDYVAAMVDELTALAPKPGEESELSQRRTVLKNADQLKTALSDARQALGGDRDVESALRLAEARIGRAAGMAGGRLDEAAAALARAVVEAGEAVAALDRAAERLEAEPTALEQVDDRLFQLRSAARKHRCTIDELPDVLARFEARLVELDTAGVRVTTLTTAAAAARSTYVRAADALHKVRSAAAERLDRAVAKELPPLKLDKARIRTLVELAPENQWNERGSSRVVFEAATNPGTAPGPLGKIASGGELARFMLALKVVLAASQPPATMIFDEVDAGISGATAAAVGERLARLARDTQVFVVTHSPQVAARATHHWRVSKSTRAGATVTRLEAVAESRRREEIARMLSGASVTDEARAAAERLLAGTPS